MVICALNTNGGLVLFIIVWLKLTNMNLVARKPVFGFPTRFDTVIIQNTKLKKLTGGLKFRIYRNYM